MQIDLQPPLSITKITHGDAQLKFEREGNVYWVMFEKDFEGVEDKDRGVLRRCSVVSKNPPGWRDNLGKRRSGTTFYRHHLSGYRCKHLVAQKDHGADEPDRGMQTSVTVPENLVAVSNGRLKKTDHNVAGKKDFSLGSVEPDQ